MKYRELIANRNLVATFLSLLLFGAQGFGHDFQPDLSLFKPVPKGINLMEDLRDFADVIRDSDYLPDLLNDPRLTAVTREFGPSVISTKQLPFRSEVAVASTPKPWSSWWYPKKDDFLFANKPDGTKAPFVKYDLYRTARLGPGTRTQSAAEFERNSYNSNTLAWEGLCDAWAIASLAMPEPKKPVTYRIGTSNVTFSVRDLKGLLLKTYEGVTDSELKYYGQKFTGDINGWIYPDLFPDQLHRLVEVQLFKNKQPFIMDHDPGIEVWNVPVYKANFLVSAVPNEPDSVFVRTWLYSAESVHPDELDFVGTKEAVREYDYILKGTRNEAGDLVVNSGYWIKGPDGIDSRSDHPDFAAIIPDPSKLTRKSRNPEIDPRIVDEILSHSY